MRIEKRSGRLAQWRKNNEPQKQRAMKAWRPEKRRAAKTQKDMGKLWMATTMAVKANGRSSGEERRGEERRGRRKLVEERAMGDGGRSEAGMGRRGKGVEKEEERSEEGRTARFLAKVGEGPDGARPARREGAGQQPST